MQIQGLRLSAHEIYVENGLSIAVALIVLVTLVLFQRHRMRARVIPPLDLTDSMSDDDIEVSPMKENEFYIALDIAANAFCKNNPVVSHLGIGRDVFKTFTRSEYSIEDVKTGLCLVARLKGDERPARLKGDEKPMAFLIMSDFDLTRRTSEMDLFIESNPKFKVMREMTENIFTKACLNALLGNGLCIGSMASRTKACWATLGGTFPGYEGRGLGKLLRKHAVELARKRGYNCLIVEPIHGSTRHIWTKYCRAEIMSEQPFEDFRSPSGILGESPMRGVHGSSSICQVLLREPSWIDSPFLALFQIIRICIQLGDFKPLFKYSGWLILLSFILIYFSVFSSFSSN